MEGVAWDMTPAFRHLAASELDSCMEHVRNKLTSQPYILPNLVETAFS